MLNHSIFFVSPFSCSCFLSNPIVFWVSFLGPMLAVILINIVIFTIVIVILVKHTRRTAARKKEQAGTKTVVRLIISVTGIMFLFGISWLFAALTITVEEIRTPSQVLFTIFNSLQGFFVFLFFCVFSNEARESWKEFLSGGRYKSSSLHPSRTPGNMEMHRRSEDTRGYSSSGTILRNYSSSIGENITLDDSLVNPFSGKKDFKSEPSDRNVDADNNASIVYSNELHGTEDFSASNKMEMESIGVSRILVFNNKGGNNGSDRMETNMDHEGYDIGHIVANPAVEGMPLQMEEVILGFTNDS